MKTCIMIIFLALSQLVFSQNTEFDNSLSNWSGTLAKFSVNNNTLHQNDSLTGSSFLFCHHQLENELEWNIKLQLSFSPSSNNSIKLYIAADTNNPNLISNGYYLHLGESGSADRWTFYKISFGQDSLLARGKTNYGSEKDSISLKIVHQNNQWTVLSSPTGDTPSTFEFNIADTNSLKLGYSGFQNQYTSSRSKGFSFLEYSISPYRKDTIAPYLTAVDIINDTTMIVSFNEAIDTSSVALTTFKLKNRLPWSVLICNLKKVIIYFSPIIPNIPLTLSATDIKDLAGNTKNSDLSFIYSLPNVGDIIISEYLYDPDPLYGLPNSEFVEILNTTNSNIQLEGWQLCDEKGCSSFPKYNLPAHSVAIVSPTEAMHAFQVFGNVIGLKNFPALNNDGDIIRIKSKQSFTIDNINYTPTQFKENLKGKSIIRSSTQNNMCSSKVKWKTGFLNNGSSLGRINSELKAPYFTTPYDNISSIEVLNKNLICIHFNSYIRSHKFSFENISISNEIGIKKFIYKDSIVSYLWLETTPLEEEISYTLLIKNTSCKTIAIPFGFPRTIEFGNLLLNEILFDPTSQNDDFIELTNRTASFITTKGLKIGISPSEYDELEEVISLPQKLIPPYEFLALTNFNDWEKDSIDLVRFLNTQLPSLPNSGKTISLMDSNNLILDQFTYNESLHASSISNTKGISLERITHTMKNDQWGSASTLVMNTAGRTNSIQKTINNNQFDVSPKLLDLQRTTNNSFFFFSYSLSNNNTNGSCLVFNENGQLLITLLSNERLGNKGSFTWDGSINGIPLSTGNYIILWETWDEHGETRAEKIVVTIVN